MTDPRLELLRRSYHAYQTLDPDAAAEVWHSDGEWDMGSSVGAVSQEPVFRGHDGLRRFFADLADWADRIEAEILAARSDGEKILIRGVNRLHAREHQVEVTNQPFGQVCEFRRTRRVMHSPPY